MMNKQPFYHQASVLFTGTETIPGEEVERVIEAAFAKAFKKKFVRGSVTVETCDSEPGDPADLC